VQDTGGGPITKAMTFSNRTKLFLGFGALLALTLKAFRKEQLKHVISGDPEELEEIEGELTLIAGSFTRLSELAHTDERALVEQSKGQLQAYGGCGHVARRAAEHRGGAVDLADEVAQARGHGGEGGPEHVALGLRLDRDRQVAGGDPVGGGADVLQVAAGDAREEAGRAVGEIASAVSDVAQGAERQVRMVEATREAVQEAARRGRRERRHRPHGGAGAKRTEDGIETVERTRLRRRRAVVGLGPAGLGLDRGDVSLDPTDRRLGGSLAHSAEELTALVRRFKVVT
jgi:hypothetical protein